MTEATQLDPANGTGSMSEPTGFSSGPTPFDRRGRLSAFHEPLG
jgi:hypothetical protein